MRKRDQRMTNAGMNLPVTIRSTTYSVSNQEANTKSTYMQPFQIDTTGPILTSLLSLLWRERKQE